MASPRQQSIEKECLKDLLAYQYPNKYVKQLIKKLSACEYDATINDCPDIVMFDKTNVYGIEHFRVSSALTINSNRQRVVFGDNYYRKILQQVSQKGFLEIQTDKELSESTLKDACEALNEAFSVISKTSYYDLTKSFEYGISKHISKIKRYRLHLQTQHSQKSSLLFMIEIYFPFEITHQSIFYGCMTKDMLNVIKKYCTSDFMLDGVILLMRDILQINKYSVFYIDMKNFDKSVRKQKICQTHIDNLLDSIRLTLPKEITYRKQNGDYYFEAKFTT